MQHAIRRTLLNAEQAAIRAMLAYPIDEEAARFSIHFGFITSPLREQQLVQLFAQPRCRVRNPEFVVEQSSEQRSRAAL